MFFTELSHVVQVRAEGPGLGASALSGRVGLTCKIRVLYEKNQCSGASSEGLPGFILR